MSKSYIKGTTIPKTSSNVARLSFDRPGGRQKAKRQDRQPRQSVKRDLRAGRWES